MSLTWISKIGNVDFCHLLYPFNFNLGHRRLSIELNSIDFEAKVVFILFEV